MNWAIIPVKPLHDGKSRLASVLSIDERAALTQQFLTQIVLTLETHPAVDRCLIVSKDDRFLEWANDAVELYAEEDPLDLNIAVNSAAAYAWQQSADSVLVIPSDLPYLQTEDIDTLVAADDNIVICSDRHGSGTNAVLLRSVPSFRFQYGPDSFERHLREAGRCDTTATVVDSPGLRFDLDTPTDWLIYQERMAASVPGTSGVVT